MDGDVVSTEVEEWPTNESTEVDGVAHMQEDENTEYTEEQGVYEVDYAGTDDANYNVEQTEFESYESPGPESSTADGQVEGYLAVEQTEYRPQEAEGAYSDHGDNLDCVTLNGDHLKHAKSEFSKNRKLYIYDIPSVTDEVRICVCCIHDRQ